MQTFEIKIGLPYEILINLHKSTTEAVEDIKQQAAIRYYKKRILSLGTLSVLRTAKNKKIVSRIRPAVEEMIQKGLWYSSKMLLKNSYMMSGNDNKLVY